MSASGVGAAQVGDTPAVPLRDLIVLSQAGGALELPLAEEPSKALEECARADTRMKVACALRIATQESSHDTIRFVQPKQPSDNQ